MGPNLKTNKNVYIFSRIWPEFFDIYLIPIQKSIFSVNSQEKCMKADFKKEFANLT